ncbi:MAG: hypothetical protein FJ091_05185 [Deltaproteobacteria bacterium]|nr:hypothetical protein [Deltaproteobacteria bacterium]
MKPDPQRVLEQTAAQLGGEILLAVQPRYRQAGVGMLAGLLGAIREEFDRAAARRVEENAALRALFARGAEIATDAALAARLRAAAASRDDSLLVPALDAANQQLRALLIALHAHVEALATPAARELDAAIWRELAASTARRKLSLGAF